MTRRRIKTWKRILVSILTLAIIAGNLSSQVVVVKAAEIGELDNLEEVYDPEPEVMEEAESEAEAESVPEIDETQDVQVVETTDGEFVITTVDDGSSEETAGMQGGEDVAVTDEITDPGAVSTENGEPAIGEAEESTLDENGNHVLDENGNPILSEEGSPIEEGNEDAASETFLVKYLFPGNNDVNYPDSEKEFQDGDFVTFPKTEESYKWEW